VSALSSLEPKRNLISLPVLRISIGHNKPGSEKSSTIVGTMIFKEQIENSSQKS
jgi:hypothetical protein